MKRLMVLIVTIGITFLSPAFSQTETEKQAITVEVRKLDSLHAAAVLSGNLGEMDKYWTEDFIVTNPFNEIDRADRIRTRRYDIFIVPKNQ